jgi:hypothetical protein
MVLADVPRPSTPKWPTVPNPGAAFSAHKMKVRRERHFGFRVEEAEKKSLTQTRRGP